MSVIDEIAILIERAGPAIQSYKLRMERHAIFLSAFLPIPRGARWSAGGGIQRRYMTLETLEALSDDRQARPRRIAAA